MKKFITVIFALTMLFVLASCGENTEKDSVGSGGSEQTQGTGAQQTNPPGGNGGDTETKDTLVMELDYGGGEVLTDTYSFVNGKAVSKSGLFTHSDASLAQTRYEMYSENPLYENVKLDGLLLTFDYSELGFTSFKGMDKAGIKSAAEAMGAKEKTN